MMHRFLCSRINDASIISPPHQWCIDYLAPASMMHRLSGPRINDASIMPRPHQWCIDYWCINDASKWIEKNRFRSWCIKKNRLRSWCIKKNRFRSWCIKMDRLYLQLVGFDHTLEQSVAFMKKKQNWFPDVVHNNSVPRTRLYPYTAGAPCRATGEGPRKRPSPRNNHGDPGYLNKKNKSINQPPSGDQPDDIYILCRKFAIYIS